MTRLLIIPAALAFMGFDVVLLGDALAEGSWLSAVVLGIGLFAAIVIIVPRASAHPVNASAAEDALATGGGE